MQQPKPKAKVASPRAAAKNTAADAGAAKPKSKTRRSSPFASFKITERTASILEVVVPILIGAMGLLHTSPLMFYKSALAVFASLMGFIVVCTALLQVVCLKWGTRIQHDKEDYLMPGRSAHGYKMLMREILSTTTTVAITSCMAAWSVANFNVPVPTGLVWAIDESLESYMFKFLVGIFVADAWTYWKHRILHCRPLYALHIEHHTFTNPTAFAGFALHPVETVWTFAPIALWNLIPHWIPIVFPAIFLFIALNLYLHCGYRLAAFEKTIPFTFVNTSSYHNVHHQRKSTHFGEVSSLWDWMCSTCDLYEQGVLRGMTWHQSDYVYKKLNKWNKDAAN